MLQKVLTFIHNWFERDVIAGQWQITGGTLELPHVQEGQYYRIVGSVFNDGLHQYPSDDLKDETFRGGVWALAIPPDLIALAKEIEEWESKYGEATAGPYASESFGGYSYSLAGSVAGGGSEDPTNGWQRQFSARLIPYRKI